MILERGWKEGQGETDIDEETETKTAQETDRTEYQSVIVKHTSGFITKQSFF